MERQVIVTDGQYRMTVAAVRTLGTAGYRVTVCVPADAPRAIPAGRSRYAARCVRLPVTARDGGYAEALLSLCAESDRPVLLCVGRDTEAAVSANRAAFDRVCDLLLPDAETLAALNDKAAVQTRCEELGIPTPRRFSVEPDRYPVVIKPRCGEAFGLCADKRYGIARDREEYLRIYGQMCRYDPSPIVQEAVSGDGIGVSVVMTDGEIRDVICHRRIREYPVSGGPSACCESIRDEEKIQIARRLLASFGFSGIAMVEFKGDRVLEVNPRIWGSFPLTGKCGSTFILTYAALAAGESAPCPQYRVGRRMHFLFNDLAAAAGYLKDRKFAKAAGFLPDLFRARPAMWSWGDPAPALCYFANVLKGKRHGDPH